MPKSGKNNFIKFLSQFLKTIYDLHLPSYYHEIEAVDVFKRLIEMKSKNQNSFHVLVIQLAR